MNEMQPARPEKKLKTPTGKIMIITGEASGDLHGANLVSALKKKSPNLSIFGIGGENLRKAGMEIMLEASELSVVGLTEVFSKAGNILKGLDTAKGILRDRRPDLLILIDFPDFNLHVAKTARRLEIPVLYYISPQIWAWRSGRVGKIRNLVDHMAVILPFEARFYRQNRVPVTYVGHPLLDTPRVLQTEKTKIADQGNPVVGILPGSRDGEVSRLLPVMLDAALILRRERPETRFLISVSSSVQAGLIEETAAAHPIDGSVELVPGGAERVFRRADFLIAASGTVTLEAALAGIPMVIVYKISRPSYLLGRALIKVKNISLVNLIYGETIVPELIQDMATGENIAREVSGFLSDKSGLESLKKKLVTIKDLLGGPGASSRVADIALGIMSGSQ